MSRFRFSLAGLMGAVALIAFFLATVTLTLKLRVARLRAEAYRAEAETVRQEVEELRDLLSTGCDPFKLVAELSWDSIGYSCNGLTLVVRPEGEAARKLIAIGPDADEALLSVLEDPAKGVAAHLVLSMIHDRELLISDYFFPDAMHAIREGDDLVGYKFTFNGLSWYSHSKDGNSVEDAALTDNAKSWEQRLNP